MRLFAQIVALVSRDEDQRQKLVDLTTAIDDTDEDNTAAHQSGTVSLAASATDVEYDLGGVVAGKFVLIVAYDAVRVKLNGIGSTDVELLPLDPADADIVSSLQRYAQPGFLMLRGNVTSIHLSNPSTTEAAEVFVAVVGTAA